MWPSHHNIIVFGPYEVTMIIVIGSQKGGVGKSTLTVAIASYLRQQGKSVQRLAPTDSLCFLRPSSWLEIAYAKGWASPDTLETHHSLLFVDHSKSLRDPYMFILCPYRPVTVQDDTELHRVWDCCKVTEVDVAVLCEATSLFVVKVNYSDKRPSFLCGVWPALYASYNQSMQCLGYHIC